MTKEKNNKKYKNRKLDIFIFCAIIVACIMYFLGYARYHDVTKCFTDKNKEPFTRQTIDDDFYINLSYSFPTSIKCTITSYQNIKYLELEFIFADKNKNTITSKTKNINQLDINQTYNITFDISEFSFKDLLKIEIYKLQHNKRHYINF